MPSKTKWRSADLNLEEVSIERLEERPYGRLAFVRCLLECQLELGQFVAAYDEERSTLVAGRVMDYDHHFTWGDPSSDRKHWSLVTLDVTKQ